MHLCPAVAPFAWPAFVAGSSCPVLPAARAERKSCCNTSLHNCCRSAQQCSWSASPALRPLRSAYAAPQIAYQSKNLNWILPARYYNAGALHANRSLRVHKGRAGACIQPRLHSTAAHRACASGHAQHAFPCCPLHVQCRRRLCGHLHPLPRGPHELLCQEVSQERQLLQHRRVSFCSST